MKGRIKNRNEERDTQRRPGVRKLYDKIWYGNHVSPLVALLQDQKATWSSFPEALMATQQVMDNKEAPEAKKRFW